MMDRKLLERIPPEHFRAFLEQAGWKKLEQAYFETEQWIHPKVGVDVLMPKRANLRGYGRLVAKVLQGLEVTMDRSGPEILRELQLAGADVFRIRRPTADDSTGIPLADGRTVLESAFRLMGAAAAASVHPRAVLPPRRPRLALDYLEHRLNLGHSETGSYVVTVVSDVTPLNTPGEPGLLEFLEDPFPRRVTKTAYRALKASMTFSERIAHGEDDAIQPAVAQGISADLLDALAQLIGGAGQEEGLGIEVGWAVSLPDADLPKEELWFVRHEREVLTEAARRIKAFEPLEGVPITGVVEGLHREEDSPVGSAVISCFIEGQPRKLHVQLEDLDYDRAILAHRETSVVVFRTDIEKRGARYIATAVQGFRVTDD